MDFTTCVGFYSFRVVISADGKLNITYNTVFGGFDNVAVTGIKRVVELHFRSLTVFNGNGFRLLLHILIRRCFCHSVCAGDKACENQLALFIGFRCLIIIVTCYGKFNTADITVLGSLDNFQMSCTGFQLEYRRNRVGSCQTDDDILLIRITKRDKNGIA